MLQTLSPPSDAGLRGGAQGAGAADQPAAAAGPGQTWLDDTSKTLHHSILMVRRTARRCIALARLTNQRPPLAPEELDWLR